jgi:virginiamycin B lyase
MPKRHAFAPLLFTMALPAATSPLHVEIKEFDIPTPHARPHDPAVGAEGTLWVTEQMANKLGRLDLKTGEFKEYPPKTSDSGPRGLVADRDGNIWFAAIFKGYIGKLDPKSGALTE